jgi:predicted nucleic-acid-binding protein
MIGLDTNILLRWLIDESIWPDDNPGQSAAVRTLLEDDTERFFANDVAVSETMWVLEKPMKRPKQVLVEVLDRLLMTSNLTIQSREAIAAARRSFDKYKVGLHDRLIAEMNSHAGCAWTATFDKSASKTPGFRLLGPKG